jgi:ABC-type branched-subunit amino acid transport system ATPase component
VAPLVLLEVSHLSKKFGGVHAVEDCSFRVDANEVVGLIGPNGAGKSTVINLVSGFETASDGVVLFDGVNVSRKPAHQRSNLGLLRSFQLARVWDRLTLLENLLVAASKPSREVVWRQFVPNSRSRQAELDDRSRAREVLEEFDLLSLKNTPAGQLSGGQRRLLEFARILMARPRLVLLDEPSASLSPFMSERIADGIGRLSRAGIAVLLIEHDLPLVESTCSRILCMAAGKLIAEGSMEDLRGNELVVRAYLGAAKARVAVRQTQ